jgi:hypothetical protein
MLVLEITSTLVTVVAFLLGRLDRHVDRLRSRPDAVEALAELYRTTRDWGKAAEQLNRVYTAEVDSGLPPGDFDSWSAQKAYVEYFDELVGGLGSRPEPGKRPPAGMEVLDLYAPEIKDELSRVAEVRRQQFEYIHAVMNDYAANAEAQAFQQRDLETAAADLSEAAEKLRQFIVSNFPATSL